jgi:hypothetical protein
MASAWGFSWLRSWKDTWGSLTPINVVYGEGHITAIAEAECRGAAVWTNVSGGCEAIATITTEPYRTRYGYQAYLTLEELDNISSSIDDLPHSLDIPYPGVTYLIATVSGLGLLRRNVNASLIAQANISGSANYKANGASNFYAVAETDVSGRMTYAGFGAIQGIAQITGNGRYKGKNWVDVVVGANTWQPATVGANTWADVAVSSNNWDNVPTGSNTWTDVAKDENTWRQLG